MVATAMSDEVSIETAEETLDPATLAEIAAFGEERPVAAGDVLYHAGDDSPS
jgi:hypothetical protein